MLFETRVSTIRFEVTRKSAHNEETSTPKTVSTAAALSKTTE